MYNTLTMQQNSNNKGQYNIKHILLYFQTFYRLYETLSYWYLYVVDTSCLSFKYNHSHICCMCFGFLMYRWQRKREKDIGRKRKRDGGYRKFFLNFLYPPSHVKLQFHWFFACIYCINTWICRPKNVRPFRSSARQKIVLRFSIIQRLIYFKEKKAHTAVKTPKQIKIMTCLI